MTFTQATLNSLGELLPSSRWYFRSVQGGQITPGVFIVWYHIYKPHVSLQRSPRRFLTSLSFIALITGEWWMVRVMNIIFKEKLTFRYISLPWSHSESEQLFLVSLPFTLTPESHDSNIYRGFWFFVPILEYMFITTKTKKIFLDKQIISKV